MRDLTLLETGCLAALLLLSLVLPLLFSMQGQSDAALRRACLRTVWFGQGLLGVAGVTVLVSAGAAPLALMLGVLSCGACAVVLRRQMRLELSP